MGGCCSKPVIKHRKIMPQNFQTLFFPKHPTLNYPRFSPLLKKIAKTKIFVSPEDEGEIYVAKNCVTLHNYNDPQNPVYHGVQKNQDVIVLEQDTKWWKVKHGRFVGYASRYYFAAKNVKNSYESEGGRQSRIELRQLCKNVF